MRRDTITVIAGERFHTWATHTWEGYLWFPWTDTGVYVPYGQPDNMTWEDYIKDREVVREFWTALREHCPGVQEPTQAGPDEDMTFWQLAWDSPTHHVDVDLFLDKRPEDHGANEWFYLERRKPRVCLDSEVASDWEGLINALTRAGMVTTSEEKSP